MNVKSLTHRIKTASPRSIGLFTCFSIICLMGLVLRYKLIAAETFDYTHFLKPWYDYLSLHGLRSFNTGFANYNTPYLLLLWGVTHLPIGELAAIKCISIFFDIVLAFSVALMVGHFKPTGYTKYIAFATVLFLPTVFLNSSAWGQCDGIYTSFIILSLYYGLKDKVTGKLAWILWGVAFAFKLQAIFFLPFLIFLSFYKKWKWYVPAYAIGTFCILSVLPVLEGRSVIDTLSIYINQAKHPTADLPMLAWFSPTFYQFMPNELYAYLKSAGLMLGGAASVAIIAFAFYPRRYSKEVLLAIATLSLFAVPYFMPQIHERYMFSAEIIIVILAFVIPKFAWAAIAMQFVTIVTYNSYFTGGNGQPQLSYPVLSLIVLGIIYYISTRLYKSFTVTTSQSHDLKKALPEEISLQ